jgi:hypothetical protein
MSEALTGAYRYYQLTRFRERETRLLTQGLLINDLQYSVDVALTGLFPA